MKLTAWMVAVALVWGITWSEPARAADRPAAAPPPSELGRLSGDLQALARRVGPAVVQIFVSSLVPGPQRGEAVGGLLSRQRGSGSGVIVDAQGTIVTNAHVVAGARRVQVQLAEPRPGSPGRSILKPSGPRLEARIIGMDLETDIAVIKIEATNLPTLSFADSDQLRQGQVVLAFGNPLGLESSVSLGVISSTVRQIEQDSPMVYLQTDAPIHPGSSGGPLIDTGGAVVGINTFILDPSVGDAVGFAAPSNIVSAVVAQIRQHGRVRRGVMGARAQTVTPELARGLGLKQDWGVVLSDIYPGGPAERAGLKPGDVVVSLDGKTMENGRHLDVNLYRRAAGEEVLLLVRRDGDEKPVRVTLSERPGDFDRLTALVRAEDHLVEPLQILALTVDPQLAQSMPMRQPFGVLVAASTGDAPPGGAPLVPGDVIRAIGRASVRTLDDLRQGLAKYPAGAWVALHVEREGRMTYVAFELP